MALEDDILGEGCLARWVWRLLVSLHQRQYSEATGLSFFSSCTEFSEQKPSFGHLTPFSDHVLAFLYIILSNKLQQRATAFIARYQKAQNTTATWSNGEIIQEQDTHYQGKMRMVSGVDKEGLMSSNFPENG